MIIQFVIEAFSEPDSSSSLLGSDGLNGTERFKVRRLRWVKRYSQSNEVTGRNEIAAEKREAGRNEMSFTARDAFMTGRLTSTAGCALSPAEEIERTIKKKGITSRGDIVF